MMAIPLQHNTPVIAPPETEVHKKHAQHTLTHTNYIAKLYARLQ